MCWFYILFRCGCCEIVGVLNMVIGIVGVIIACLIVFGLVVGGPHGVATSPPHTPIW